jgi:hypothetical protein
MKNDLRQWPAFLVSRHSLPITRRPAKPAPRRARVIPARKEFPRVAILTHRRPLPKGH